MYVRACVYVSVLRQNDEIGNHTPVGIHEYTFLCHPHIYYLTLLFLLSLVNPESVMLTFLSSR